MDHEQTVHLQGLELRPEFVLPDVGAESNIQAIELLAGKLLNEGMVKPGFLPAILKREEEYCTGLAFPEMGIAIPHTDAEYVIRPCIAIASLKKPVMFQSMGMPDVPCEVEMVFMLGITEPEKQLNFLQTLMKVFQTEGRLLALKKCKTPEELEELFKSYFV